MNIIQLRKDTPGSRHHIHLNNAGASFPTKYVVEAMQTYIAEEAFYGGYEMEAARMSDFMEFYEAYAKLLNCAAYNIAFSHSASDGYGKALSSIPFERGDVILTTDDDYVSNHFAFIFLKKRYGIEIIRAEKFSDGGVAPDSMKKLMEKHRPKLVAVAHVPTNSGLIQAVGEIGKMCREKETLYLVDACQSVGQMPVDVQAIGCDFLSATTRKWMRGPRGAGFLYVSDRVLEMGLEPVFPDFTVGHWTGPEEYKLERSARTFEYWERNWALVLGATEAAKYAMNQGLENIQNRVVEIATHTRNRLGDVPGWKILDQGQNNCGIVSAHSTECTPEQVTAALREANVNAGVARTKNALIDFNEKGVTWALRLSSHYYNTKAEVDVAVEALKNIRH